MAPIRKVERKRRKIKSGHTKPLGVSRKQKARRLENINKERLSRKLGRFFSKHFCHELQMSNSPVI